MHVPTKTPGQRRCGTHGTWLRFWRNAFFKVRFFSLAASWQMACKFLSNTLSSSIPWIFSEINYHWVFTKLGQQKSKPDFFVFVFHEDGSTKIKAWFFVFVKQAICILHICTHMKSFLSVSLCPHPSCPIFILFQTKSFIFENFPYCQNHFDLWHLCCSWFVYVIFITEPPPHSGPSFVTKPLWHLSFSSISPFKPQFLISFRPVCSACVYVCIFS